MPDPPPALRVDVLGAAFGHPVRVLRSACGDAPLVVPERIDRTKHALSSSSWARSAGVVLWTYVVAAPAARANSRRPFTEIEGMIREGSRANSRWLLAATVGRRL